MGEYSYQFVGVGADMRGPPLEQFSGLPSDTFGLTTPELAAIVLAGALLLVGLAAAARFLLRSEGSSLRRRLAAKDRVTILMHPNPDPDAMACAMAIKHMASSVGTDAVLQYPGEIRHQENRAFRTVLDLDLRPVEASADIIADAVVLVDHNRPRGFDGARDVHPYAIVDHHPGSGSGSAFTDVRDDYGACASIVAEYYRALDAEAVSPEDDPEDISGLTLSAPVATGLLYGILSDTNHLTKGCSAAEFSASRFLYPAVDENALDRIANPQVDAEVLDVKARAINNRDTRAPYAVSDVGEVGNLDAIPQAADELMHLEGVTAVVVVGDRDGYLHISGRSRDDRVHMGRALEHVVDDIPMASAGGHARMGGGRLSIEHMNGIGPSDGVTRDQFHERCFDAMAGEE